MRKHGVAEFGHARATARHVRGNTCCRHRPALPLHDYKRVSDRPAYHPEPKSTGKYTHANTLTPILTLPEACTKLQTTCSIRLEPQIRWFQKRPKMRKHGVAVFGQVRVRPRGGWVPNSCSTNSYCTLSGTVPHTTVSWMVHCTLGGTLYLGWCTVPRTSLNLRHYATLHVRHRGMSIDKNTCSAKHNFSISPCPASQKESRSSAELREISTPLSRIRSWHPPGPLMPCHAASHRSAPMRS